MSFLSKNGAGILACLLISIVSWFLGGFFPVVGAPVFAIFAGMLLHPWLSPYKQLDAGLTFSSKKLPSMPLSYSVLVSISRKSLQLDKLHSLSSFPPFRFP